MAEVEEATKNSQGWYHRMTETEFNLLVDATLLRIESALEASELDLDFETANGILEIEFENGSKVIVNRQAPNREIWVAARSGGFHFRRSGEDWIDTRGGKSLFDLIEEVVSLQAGRPAALRF
jgi:CyaY protein